MSTILYFHFLLGPLMLVVSYVYKRFPPKKINHFYGYRTPRSMRSIEAWNSGNQYGAKAMIVVSGLTCLVQLITSPLMSPQSSIIWSAVFMSIGLVAVIPATEIHLKKQGFN